LRFEPFDRESRFMASLNMNLMQRALWPLLADFILHGFSDTSTTLVALLSSPGFVEFNRLGSSLFGQGFKGFLAAYLLKFVPVAPLFYMVAVRSTDLSDDFQVRLLKLAALVVLIFSDSYLGVIVLGNNLPLILRYRLSLG
jgi:hypothetical protein